MEMTQRTCALRKGFGLEGTEGEMEREKEGQEEEENGRMWEEGTEEPVKGSGQRARKIRQCQSVGKENDILYY